MKTANGTASKPATNGEIKGEIKIEIVAEVQPQQTRYPPPEAIYDAMMHAQDVLERALMPFVVLGTAAYQMMNNEELRVNKVVFGVLERYASKECTSMLPIIEPKIEKLTDGWQITRHNVPVYIKILPKVYPSILNPDLVFYMYDMWHIPNPFGAYWTGGDHFDI